MRHQEKTIGTTYNEYAGEISLISGRIQGVSVIGEMLAWIKYLPVTYRHQLKSFTLVIVKGRLYIDEELFCT